MPIIFGAGARGGLVRLTCPLCGEVQVRARGPVTQEYTCRKCGKTFTGDAGRTADARRSSAPPRRSRK